MKHVDSYFKRNTFDNENILNIVNIENWKYVQSANVYFYTLD